MHFENQTQQVYDVGKEKKNGNLAPFPQCQVLPSSNSKDMGTVFVKVLLKYYKIAIVS